MEGVKRKYVYYGAVMQFATIVARNVSFATMAVSDRQAEKNILYQFKKKYGYTSATKFTLAEKPILESEILQ